MRALAVLRHRSIALLWSGLLLSSLGDAFYGMALMWLGVHLAGNAVGVIAAAQHASTLVFGLLGGAYVDRYDRRTTMISADLVRAAAVGALPLFAAFGGLTLAHLVVVAIVLGACNVLFQPALHASLPGWVEKPEELQAANALVDITSRIARTVAPSLGGFVATHLALHHFFTLDAISFGLSAATIFALAPRLAIRRANAAPETFAREIAEAFSFVKESPPLRWALSALFVSMIAWASAFGVGAPLFAARVLSGDIGAYGFILGAYGLGNIVSNLIGSNVQVRAPIRFVITGKFVLAAGFAVLAMAPSLHVAMAGAFLAAVGGPIEHLAVLAMIQRETPPHRMGKVFALRMIMESGGYALGLLFSQQVYAHVPVRVGIALGSAGYAAIGLAGLRSRRRLGMERRAR
jgi:MFS transporter, DHA3 family, macrolide efflux protein